MDNFDLFKADLVKEIIAYIPVELGKILIAYCESFVKVEFSQLGLCHGSKVISTDGQTKIKLPMVHYLHWFDSDLR